MGCIYVRVDHCTGRGPAGPKSITGGPGLEFMGPAGNSSDMKCRKEYCVYSEFIFPRFLMLAIHIVLKTCFAMSDTHYTVNLMLFHVLQQHFGV